MKTNKESVFQKYLLCEQSFGSVAKKSVLSTVSGYLTSFKKESMTAVRKHLEHVQRINNYEETSDVIDKELERLNAEYMSKLTEFLNSRKFS